MNVQLNNEASDKKHLIFESTLRLISQFGFHGTPISHIAQNAGVATGTIYHYFESKDELIIELFKFTADQTQKKIVRIDNQSLSYRKRFELIWIGLVEHYIENPEILNFFDQFFSSPYSREFYPEGQVSFHDEISVFLKQGINNSELKDMKIDIASSIFIGTISATVKRNINGRFTFNKDDIQKMVEIVWEGLKFK